MSIKNFGIILTYPPGTKLHTEGLGRLLASFLDAASKRKDVQVTIVCPSWSKRDLVDLFNREAFEGSSFRILTPSKIPVIVRMLLFYRRWSKKKFRGPGRLFRVLSWARARARGALARVGSRLVSARSLLIFLFWLLATVALALIAALPAFLIGLIWCIRRVGTVARGWVLRKRSLFRAYLRLIRMMRNPSSFSWTAGIFDALNRQELCEIVAIADRQISIRSWFTPNPFTPEICSCRSPLLICVPDVVFNDAPVGFAGLDSAGRITARLQKIESTLMLGRAFTTYSGHVARNVLMERYGVLEKGISIIPHAAANLARWIEVRGFPDNEAATRTYCRNLFRQALNRSDNKSYLSNFANSEVRYLFYASQFRPSKNVIGLLRVYERLLRRKYIGHKLVLTGNPAVSREVRDFVARHRLEYDVLFLIDISSVELAACYKLADLAVNPTFSEGGCPFTLTEALSVGTPVVMSRIAVTTEVVAEQELQRLMLFDPRNLDDMERCIFWALSHRAELLAAQLPLFRRLVERTWDNVLDDHLTALERVAGDRNGML